MTDQWVIFTDSGGNSERVSAIEEDDTTFVAEVKLPGGGAEPYGICTTKHGRIAVTDRRYEVVRLYFYTPVSNTFVEDTTNSPTVEPPGGWSNIEGIAHDFTNDRLYVCDSGQSDLVRWADRQRRHR